MSSKISSKNKKILLIVICILFIICNALFVYFLVRPSIKLLGDKEIHININAVYEEPGYTAKYLGSNVTDKIEVTNNVDSTKIGTYTIKYVLQKGNVKKEVTRTVIVEDMESPSIELTGDKEKYLCPNQTYEEEGYQAFDNIDGDITRKVERKEESGKIIYMVKDANNNYTEVTRKLNYEDKEAPIIELKGGETYTIGQNQKYNDLGYTVTDNCDGDLSSQVEVTGEVDTSKIGEYTITYTVKDAVGNEATTTRKVKVVEQQASNDYVGDGRSIVYLTFDDGPGQYTEKILSILKENDIKATFFVTNQFPRYQGMIKKEYEDGHTVAVHTYSHQWAIYDSEDAYLNDFNKMNEIVKEQTGSYAKYFRFPGGSSNTVSRKHQLGIMTSLANLMQSKGYTYYDWDVDCGDTHSNNTVDYIIKMVKTYTRKGRSNIILMHDIKKNTMEALPSIISYLKGQGFEFAAIDENTPVKHFKIAN